MKCKIVVIWWLVNDKKHDALKDKDKSIDALIPLVSALFPGINYYSVTGFTQVMRDCVIPALKKQFPQLLGIPASEIGSRTMVNIAEVLRSKGYELQNSPRWQSKFKRLLLTA